MRSPLLRIFTGVPGRQFSEMNWASCQRTRTQPWEAGKPNFLRHVGSMACIDFLLYGIEWNSTLPQMRVAYLTHSSPMRYQGWRSVPPRVSGSMKSPVGVQSFRPVEQSIWRTISSVPFM